MRRFFLLSLIVGCFFLCSATLWDDAAGDIYSRKIRYRVNDSVKIKIDEKTKLKYTGSSKTLKTTSITSQGGELAGVFEIVPSADVNESKESSDKDELEYVAELQGRIIDVKNNYAIELESAHQSFHLNCDDSSKESYRAIFKWLYSIHIRNKILTEYSFDDPSIFPCFIKDCKSLDVKKESIFLILVKSYEKVKGVLFFYAFSSKI